jgi:hypothetical protein
VRIAVTFPRLLRLGFALVLVAAAFGLRHRGLAHQIWSVDEGSTFTMADQILHGEIPYLNAADNRNPLAPYAKAVIFAVAGEWNVAAVHGVVALMLGLAAVLLWRLARRLGEEATGVAAAVWFTLLSFGLMAVYDSMAAHTGWFMVFFSCLGFLFFARAWAAPQSWPAFASGLAFGLSCLAKQPGLLDFGVALVIIGLGWFFQPERRRHLLWTAVLMVAGFVLPVALTVAYFAAHGAFRDLVMYAWTYNTKYYVPEVPLGERLSCIRIPFLLAWTNAPVALVAAALAAAGLLKLAFGGLRQKPAQVAVLPWLILGWCASGLVSTALSGRTFDHYSMQVIAPLALACGWTTARVAAYAGPAWRRYRLAGVAVVLLLAGAAATLVVPALRRARKFDPDEEGSRWIGDDVRAQTCPVDRLFVWGYAPELYVFAQRLPATRFLYTNYLTGLIPWTNLDPMKNTDYAIIPGAWDGFWSDWIKHPPELIVDTMGERGYLKYPLEKQPKLWPIVQRDYAEVEPEKYWLHGCRVYRRAVVPLARHVDPAWKVDPSIRVQGLRSGPQADRRFAVYAPSPSTALELYLDGSLYRRIAVSCQAEQEVVFTVLAADLPLGTHEVQAVAHGAGVTIGRPYTTVVGKEVVATGPAGGPPLIFEDRQIAALETETFDGSHVGHTGVLPCWDAHAPSRMVYPRPAEMDQIVINYGMHEAAYGPDVPKKSDGYDVVVNFEDEKGDSTRVFFRRLDPVRVAHDRGPQSDHFPLPLGQRGKVIFLMTSGPLNDATSDWTYWYSINGYRGPLVITFQGRLVYPEHTKAELGAFQLDYRGSPVVVAHAPSAFDFPLQTGMVDLAGGFGLLDTAWNGKKQTIGAVFEIAHLRPDGTQRMLMQRSLEPAKYEADRGMIQFRIKIPQPAEGSLRLITRSPEAGKNEYCYTFWHRLVAGELPVYLRFDGRDVTAQEARSEHGITNLEEDGKPTLLAHAPSKIVFNLEPGMRHLQAEYGLLRAAFTAPGDTDGAVFVVEVESATGERTELFRQHVNPMHEGAHRSPQKLDLALPERPGGRLILRTELAPSGRLSYAWSYWRSLVGTK